MKNVEIKWVEKSTAGGRYDMVISYTDSETLMVVELKKGEINIDALNQLSGYLTNNESEENNEKYQYGLLVGTSISSEVKTIISKEKNIYAIVLSRFSQGAQEYVSTTVYKPQDTKDYTKYTLTNLQGDIISKLGKGKIVVRNYKILY